MNMDFTLYTLARRFHVAAIVGWIGGVWFVTLVVMPAITRRETLPAHRLVGYIPDMIFGKELDYLAELGAGAVPLASNSVSVQLMWLRAGAGIGIVHDFAMPFAPGLRRVLAGQVALTRAFWLIRHADDRRSDRMTRFAEALTQGLRREVARLEALAAGQ